MHVNVCVCYQEVGVNPVVLTVGFLKAQQCICISRRRREVLGLSQFSKMKETTASAESWKETKKGEQ
jgi:hypothetical protein